MERSFRSRLRSARDQSTRSTAESATTQTQFNATLGWNDYNFIGGGRQFSVTGAYSNVTSVFDAKLLQPDFITPPLSLTLEGSGQQQSYQTYTAYIVGLDPHLDYKFTRF